MGVRRRTSEEFKKFIFKKYNGKIEILGEYEGSNEPIKFVYHCEQHGDTTTMINAKNISSNKTLQPCKECMREFKSKKYKTSDELLNELKAKAAERGGRLLSDEWVKSKHKYKFKCSNENHPIFESTHDSVIGSKQAWCPYCAGRVGDFNAEINDIVIKNDGVLLTNYESAYRHVRVKCNKDDYEWDITPSNLKKGRWCYVCAMPRSERIVYDLLIESKFKVVPQYSFQNLLGDNKQGMRFDFAIFDGEYLKFLIEIDDNEHRYNHSGKSKRGKERIRAQQRDLEKTEYCKTNGITLLRIDIDIYLDTFKDDDKYKELIKNSIIEKGEDLWR